MQRLFGVARETLMGWIKKVKMRKISDELLDAEPTDVFELDEFWSFVKSRRHKVRTWIALLLSYRSSLMYVVNAIIKHVQIYVAVFLRAILIY